MILFIFFFLYFFNIFFYKFRVLESLHQARTGELVIDPKNRSTSTDHRRLASLVIEKKIERRVFVGELRGRNLWSVVLFGADLGPTVCVGVGCSAAEFFDLRSGRIRRRKSGRDPPSGTPASSPNNSRPEFFVRRPFGRHLRCLVPPPLRFCGIPLIITYQLTSLKLYKHGDGADSFWLWSGTFQFVSRIASHHKLTRLFRTLLHYVRLRFSPYFYITNTLILNLLNLFTVQVRRVKLPEILPIRVSSGVLWPLQRFASAKPQNRKFNPVRGRTHIRLAIDDRVRGIGIVSKLWHQGVGRFTPALNPEAL